MVSGSCVVVVVDWAVGITRFLLCNLHIQCISFDQSISLYHVSYLRINRRPQ